MIKTYDKPSKSMVQQTLFSCGFDPSENHELANTNHFLYSSSKHKGIGKDLFRLNTIYQEAMTDQRTARNQGQFNLRSHQPTLKIVRDGTKYQEQTGDVKDRMENFTKKKIDVPDATCFGRTDQDAKKAKTTDEKIKNYNPEQQDSAITNLKQDAPMIDQTKDAPGAGGNGPVSKIDGKTGSKESPFEESSRSAITASSVSPLGDGKDKNQDTKQLSSGLSVKLTNPDLFVNCKIKDINKFFDYSEVRLKGQQHTIPVHYVRYVEPINDEKQNTEEKFWSFKEKNYECTQGKIEELKKFDIQISPSDFEWVIDHFEKAAINDRKLHVKELIESFQKEGPQGDIQKRVTDKIMTQIYKECWKTQREVRKNRPFIRDFWHYQEYVGEDNYPTFKIQEEKKGPSTRGNIKQKMNIYAGIFIERENAVILASMISHLHTRTILQVDVQNIEDEQFDRLLGKIPPESQPLNEEEILEDRKYMIPFITKKEEDKLKEHPNQLSIEIANKFMSRYSSYKDNTLKMVVDQHRDIHEGLRPQPQFIPPEPQNKIKGGKFGSGTVMLNGGKIGDRNRGISPNIYDEEIAYLEPKAVQETLNNVNQTKNQQNGMNEKSTKMHNGQNLPNPNKVVQYNPKGAAEESETQADVNSVMDETVENNKLTLAEKKKLVRKNITKKDEINVDLSAPNEQANYDLEVQKNQNRNRRDKRNRNQREQAQQSVDEKMDTIEKEEGVTIDDQKPQPDILKKNLKQDKAAEDTKVTVKDPSIMTDQRDKNAIANDAKPKDPLSLCKKPKKIKKSQIAGFNSIRLLTMLLHHQEKDLNLKLYGGNSQKMQRTVRYITQDVKINNETSEQMFEKVKQQNSLPLDPYEETYQQTKKGKAPLLSIFDVKGVNIEENKITNNQVISHQQIIEKEKELMKLNKEFEQLKSRKFQIRRGRNNRIFYKSIAKTIYDYMSDEDLIEQDAVKAEKLGKKRAHGNLDESNFTKNVDKFMVNQMKLIQDIEKHCTNKRLKKNIYKMEPILLMSNGQKQNIEQPAYTSASCDQVNLPASLKSSITYDPVIQRQFKQRFSQPLQDIMSYNASDQLIQKGLDPNSIFQDEKAQTLADYNEYIASRKTEACSPVNGKEGDYYNHYLNSQVKKVSDFNGGQFSLQPTEKMAVIDNMSFIKSWNKSMPMFKAEIVKDFGDFKKILTRLQEQQRGRLERNRQRQMMDGINQYTNQSTPRIVPNMPINNVADHQQHQIQYAGMMQLPPQQLQQDNAIPGQPIAGGANVSAQQYLFLQPQQQQLLMQQQQQQQQLQQSKAARN